MTLSASLVYITNFGKRLSHVPRPTTIDQQEQVAGLCRELCPPPTQYDYQAGESGPSNKVIPSLMSGSEHCARVYTNAVYISRMLAQKTQVDEREHTTVVEV